MNHNFQFALLLTTCAGLSTTIGSFLGIIYKKPGPMFMVFSLSFSAGVMLLVSFVELLSEGIKTIGFGPAHIAFFGGMIGMFLIDWLIPHEYFGEQHRMGTSVDIQRNRLQKTGLFVALGLAIHNLPEGMATFAGALEDTRLGITIAAAIAIHNIPEGLAVSVPIYTATGSRAKAFWWSFLSGVSEPIGALLAGLVFLPFLSDKVIGGLLAAVAGIMVFISLDELLPSARSFGYEHLAIIGVMIGMAVMSLSLFLLG